MLDQADDALELYGGDAHGIDDVPYAVAEVILRLFQGGYGDAPGLTLKGHFHDLYVLSGFTVGPQVDPTVFHAMVDVGDVFFQPAFIQDQARGFQICDLHSSLSWYSLGSLLRGIGLLEINNE